MKVFLFTAIMLVSYSGHQQPAKTEFYCILSSDKKVYKAGEQPQFAVAIYNNSDHDIYLPGSLDGSEMKWRYPHCYYSVEWPATAPKHPGRCGNMNALQKEDFILLEPGEKFDPQAGFFQDYTVINPDSFKKPGVYKLRFHYSTASTDITKYMGYKSNPAGWADSVQISSLFAKVPKVELVSNEIEIVVE